MRYKINAREELSRTEKRYRLFKWIAFSFILLFFYVLMRAGVFSFWQPVLLIPLAVSAAMYESELSSCIFALFCGYMTDIACDYILGFSAVWLMAVCVGAALLVRNLIRVNIINYLILCAAAVFIEFSMSYLFNVAIWNVAHKEVILTSSVIPSAVATFIFSPAVYCIVRAIEMRFSREDADVLYYDGSEDGTAEESREQGERS